MYVTASLGLTIIIIIINTGGKKQAFSVLCKHVEEIKLTSKFYFFKGLFEGLLDW